MFPEPKYERLTLRVTKWSSWEIAAAVMAHFHSAALQCLADPSAAIFLDPSRVDLTADNDAEAKTLVRDGLAHLKVMKVPSRAPFELEGEEGSGDPFDGSSIPSSEVWHVGRLATAMHSRSWGQQVYALFDLTYKNGARYALLFRLRFEGGERIFWQAACPDESDPQKMLVLRTRTVAQWNSDDRQRGPSHGDYWSVVKAFLPDAIELDLPE